MELSKNWYVMVIITILLVAILSGYIYFTNEENSSYTEYHFELEMESEKETTVYWPVPYDSYNEGDESYGNLSDLVYDLEIIEGDGSFEVKDTEKGRALQVTFEGTLKIEANKRIYEGQSGWNKYFFDDLTMRNTTISTGESYFVYSSSDYIKIVSFDCYYEDVGELDSNRPIGLYIEDFTLKEGWQSVEFSGGAPKYEEPEY